MNRESFTHAQLDNAARRGKTDAFMALLDSQIFHLAESPFAPGPLSDTWRAAFDDEWQRHTGRPAFPEGM
jgi:hypothetical protein